MINVAHCISSLNYGGSIKYVVNLLQANIKYNIPINQSLIILKIIPNSIIQNMPNNVKIFQCNFVSFRSLKQITEIKRIIEFINDNNINIIHTHDSAPNFIGTIAGKYSLNTKVISTEHTYDELRVSNNPIYLYRRLKEYIRLRSTDRIIVISNNIGSFLLENTNYSENKVVFIPHGIEIEEYKYAKPIKDILNDKSELNFAIIGRFSKVKNHLFLLKVINELNKNDLKFNYYFAGDGELRNDIDQYIKKYSLKNVFILGNIDYVPSLLKSVDAVLMPSLYEGCPLVILESMAAEKPTIGNNTKGIKEVIENQKNGLLIETNNLNKWISTLSNLNKNYLKDLGSAAFKTAEKKYNIKRMIIKTYHTYNNLLKNNG